MNLNRNSPAASLALALTLLGALSLWGCRKPAPDAEAQHSSPGPTAGSAIPAAHATSTDDLSTLAVRMLNAAHRRGGVILRGECGPRGFIEQYAMPGPARVEPMDQALQEVSIKYQNIYWRESRASGVRLVDSTAKAGLLSVRIREFRVVEDREPDGVMAVLWRQPEVKSFLRGHHVTFSRRVYGTKKALSPPMILEMKQATVAEILDRIADAYRQDPPKVWIYQECSGKKETLIDVRMK